MRLPSSGCTSVFSKDKNKDIIGLTLGSNLAYRLASDAAMERFDERIEGVVVDVRTSMDVFNVGVVLGLLLMGPQCEKACLHNSPFVELLIKRDQCTRALRCCSYTVQHNV